MNKVNDGGFYAVVTKNDGDHIFPVGKEIEIWGGRWIEENGDLSTPDGTIPAGSFKVVPESEIPKWEGWLT
jgi:hypothetical protein